MFQTFSGLPEIGHKIATNLISSKEEDRVDYVQGKKLKCPLPFKKAHSLKPLFSHFEENKRITSKDRSVSLQSKLPSTMRSFCRRDSDS